MASRSDKQKPDPAIKKNVLKTRAGMQSTKNERAIVTGASLAATLLAWAALSLHGSTSAVPGSSLSADTGQPVVSITAQPTSGTDSTVSTSLLPTATPTSQAGAVTTDSQIITTQASGAAVTVQTPVVVAVTRSSR